MGLTTLYYSDDKGPHTVDLERDKTSIGRSPSQDVVLLDRCVSREHAVLLREGDLYTVVDQDSTHGTYLNSIRVQRAVLKPGDVLQMGSLHGQRLRFGGQQHGGSPDDGRSDPATDLLSSIVRGRSEESPAGPRNLEQLNWLLRAARQLNEGSAIEDTLGALLRLSLQLTGLERGFVFLLEGDEMRFAGGLTAEGVLATEDLTISRRAIKKAVESRSTYSVTDTLADHDVSEWSSVMANQIRSIYCIPLRKRISAEQPHQLLGLIYLDSHAKPGELSEVDHQVLDTMATEAAALVHNALLAEAEYQGRQAREELAIAARIHGDLMSRSLPVLPYASLQARSVPCLAIGGDFYDALVLDDCVCVTIADVSGKGVSAAIVAATLQGIIHAHLLSGQTLPQIGLLLNEFLCTRNVGKYATLVILKLFADGRVEYLNCGHIPPIAIADKKIRRLEASNLIVGLVPHAAYSSANDRMLSGERILLVTDGLTEAEDTAGNPFGDSGLDEALHLQNLDEILDRVDRFQKPNLPQDDCTLLEIRYTGVS
jgi:sigma-B regulation protein RsbU (phosphoserine phosphatase)